MDTCLGAFYKHSSAPPFLSATTFGRFSHGLRFARKTESSKAILWWILSVIFAVQGTPYKLMAQTTVGIQPLGSYSDSGVDQIALANLGVHIDIPLFQHKGRGSGMGINIHLVYDSNYWVGPSPTTEVGWRLVPTTAVPGTVIVYEDSREFVPSQCEPGVTRCNAGYTNYTYSFGFIDSTGYGHPFNNGNTVTSVQCQGESPEPCTNVNLVAAGQAYDNSGYSFVVNPNIQSPRPNIVVVTAPSGQVYTWSINNITAMTDPNGNSGTSVGTQAYWVNWSQTLTDDANVSATITGGAYSSSDCTQWTSRAPIQVQYLDASGNPQIVTVNYSHPNVGCSAALVTSVVYPDGSSYHFTYQPDNSLASMQLPTGGTISYVTSSLAQGVNGSVGIPATVSRSTPDGTTVYNQTAVPCNSPGCIYPVTSTTTISRPDGSSEQISFVYVQSYDGTAVGTTNPSYETAHTWTSSTGTLLKSTMRCYNGATGDCTSTPVTLPITQIATTTTVDGVTSQTVQYMNSIGLTTEVDEYDFGASSPSRKTITAYASLGNGIADRPASTTVYNASGGTASNATYGYDEYSLTATTNLQGHSAVSGARGNLTSKHAWLNTTGGTLDSHWTYDDAGQVLGSEDPRLNWTYYGYDTASDLCLISTTPPAPQSGVSLATSASCDPYTGLPASSTDANGAKTSYSYDAMLRLTGTSTTTSTGVLAASMARSYSGSSLPETITNTVSATPDPDEVSSTVLDGLGRIAETVASDGSRVDTTYNLMGYVQSVSNPYFDSNDPTYGFTSYLYDGLGRKTYQCQPDNGTTTTCTPHTSYLQWTYLGNATTEKDETGNSWTRISDAFGRVTNVTEPIGTSTDYNYDALNNLTSVNQHGAAGDTPRTRSFSYDSLSRLIAASNPETASTSNPPSLTCPGATGTWTACYSYDSNGNLHTQTDNRNVVTSYSYDTVNRLTNKQSSGASGVPGFNYTYGYDAVNPPEANGIGRLLWTTNGTGEAEQYFYDAMGRMTSQALYLPSAPSTPQWTSAVYDLAGNMTDLTYPDGHHIKQALDSAGRVTGSNLVDVNGSPATQPYLQSALYSPDGSISSLSLGNNVQETVVENNRLQMHSISLASTQAPYSGNPFLSHTYCYANCTSGGVADNDNIWQVADTLNSKLNQDFTYDSLNRITGFSLGGVQNQQFHLDSFGNMSLVAGNGTPLYSFDATNKISNLPCASSAAAYDSAGNQTCDTDPNGAARTYGYDAANQIGSITMAGSSQPFETYVYSANGSRVRKTNADGTFTEYVDFGGQPIAQKDQTGNWTDYIYANGKQIAQIAPSDTAVHMHGSTTCTTCGVIGVSWFFSDPLANYVIKPGDKISWRQYQSSTVGGGIQEGWTSCGAFDPSDTTGQSTRTGNVQNAWQQRTIDLTPYVGCIFQTFRVGVYSSTATGDWDLWFADMVLYSSDGTVIPIMYRQSPISPQLYEVANETNYSVGIDSITVPAGDLSAQNTVAYTLSDHLGTAQMTFSGGGWPVWKGEFSPFGQELDTRYTPNNFKFTGKERDAESGLDHFQFRSYSSTMGRWTSPDPAGMVAVDITDPQSLNRYAYVQNNPLSFVDPLGLDCAYLNDSGTAIEKGGLDQHSSAGECGKTGGYWVDGSMTNAQINADAGTVQLTGTNDGTDTTHASYQDTSVYVGWYDNTSWNPAGHIAMAFPGQTPLGFNPKDDAQFYKQFLLHQRDARVPGAVKPQVGGQLKETVRIPVTGMQAQMIQGAINQSTLHPGNYTLGEGNGCDCGTWAQQMLGDAGINTGSPARLPSNLMPQLQQLYPQQ